MPPTLSKSGGLFAFLMGLALVLGGAIVALPASAATDVTASIGDPKVMMVDGVCKGTVNYTVNNGSTVEVSTYLQSTDRGTRGDNLKTPPGESRTSDDLDYGYEPGDAYGFTVVNSLDDEVTYATVSGTWPDCGPVEPPADADGDGVPDADDQCPNEAGPASNNGCPVVEPPADADGDGVPDADDQCPNEAGPASNNGCPVVEPPAGDFATVTGYEPFSSDANHPDYWGEKCWKVEPGGSAYVLPAGTYGKVIVKAGATNVDPYTNTIFAAPPKAGQTVWADTNGDGVYNAGGKDGDKAISHVIICPPVEQSPTPTPTPTTESPTPTPTPTTESPTPTPTPTTESPTPTPTPTTESPTPKKSKTPTSGGSVEKTGDSASPVAPAALFALGLTALAGAYWLSRKTTPTA